MKRRTVLHAGLAVAAGLVLPAHAAGPVQHAVLPQPRSIAEELARALARKKALVVMVSLRGCPYCEIVRDAYLRGLLAGGQPVVQIEMTDSAPLADAQGKASTHQEVVRALDVRVAPTLLFFGRGGREVAERMPGMPSPDYYGYYLQQRVEAANRAAA